MKSKKSKLLKSEHEILESYGEVSAPYWRKSKMVFNSDEANRIFKNTIKVINADVALSMRILTKALKKDRILREAWIANIAMAYKDNERWFKEKNFKKLLNKHDKHIIANNAAEYFIDLLCK